MNLRRPIKKSTLDLVVINPGGRIPAYQNLAGRLAAIEPPIWAGLIAGFIRNHGFSVRIVDANAERLDPIQTASMAADMAPVLTVVVVYGHNPSASTQVMPAAGEICKALKDRNGALPILIAGGHVAALPQKTLLEEHVDFTCTGEGPYTVLDLIRALKEGAQSFAGVRGLCYRDNSEIITNTPAPLLDLSSAMLRMPWDLFPMPQYRAHNWHCFGGLSRQPYAALYTTLGCPFRCNFCCIQAPFKSGEKAAGYPDNLKSYRLFDPRTIITEIDTLVNEYGVTNVKIADEIFVLNSAHVNGICDLIIDRNYDLNIWAYARVDTLNDRLLEKLRQAGFRWLALGIESASDRVRDDVSKGITGGKIDTAIRKIREHGINIGANYMFGLPEDDHGTMEQTLGLALDLNCEYANFSAAMAYPGSQLYDQAVREGWDLPGGWSGYSQYARDAKPLATHYVSSTEVLRFRDHAFRTYFERPAYLEMMSHRFGPVAVDEVREMTSVSLKRQWSI